MMLRCMLEVYVDDFMSLVIATSRQQIQHVGRAIMTGIHNVFPADHNNGEDPILEKKLIKGEGTFRLVKTLLGFVVDGNNKTL